MELNKYCTEHKTEVRMHFKGFFRIFILVRVAFKMLNYVFLLSISLGAVHNPGCRVEHIYIANKIERYRIPMRFNFTFYSYFLNVKSESKPYFNGIKHNFICDYNLLCSTPV